ncbi:response regulator [Colwelliaceae bacterium BS250]
MKTILIVEDEVKIAAVLKQYIESEGFAVSILNTGGTASAWVKQHKPSMVLLDLMLPEKNGTEICKEIRSFSQVPIIMITARVSEIDRLIGLEIGADDYICKPFSPREVVARIKVIMRRMNNADAMTQTDTKLIVDEAAFCASLNGHSLELTPVEFRILNALQTQPLKVWRREQLLNHMYEDHRAVSDRTVDSHVANLRKKLQKIRADSECIQPIYGVGYRLLEL